MLRFIILIDTALNLVLALSFAVMEPQTFPPPHLPPYIATLILISLSRLESFTSTSRASSQSPSLSSQSSALRLAYGGICLGRDVVHREKTLLCGVKYRVRGRSFVWNNTLGVANNE